MENLVYSNIYVSPIETLLDNYNHWKRKSEINGKITCKIF